MPIGSTPLENAVNSNISEWRFRLSSTNNHVNAYEIERLPMPRVEFTASEEQRAVAREEVKEMYEKRDYNALIDWANRSLAWTPESGHKGDVSNHVVHDLLAYLAERITTSIEECDKLQRTWREWVESAVPKADKLTKTFRQQGWVEVGCRDGWEGVRAEFQARKAVPDSPKDLQSLRKNTEDALRELCPLRERIEATDRLIDQIAYRLYGLTEEEISVVEGSVGPG